MEKTMATKRKVKKVTKNVAPINPRAKAIEMLYDQMSELESRKDSLETEVDQIADAIDSLEDAIHILEDMD
tara:strand:- start:107 stop:319 length:213 start_codon:yes stop_codon:yes gene_type:complete